jgi:hypothetical protein
MINGSVQKDYGYINKHFLIFDLKILVKILKKYSFCIITFINSLNTRVKQTHNFWNHCFLQSPLLDSIGTICSFLPYLGHYKIL